MEEDLHTRFQLMFKILISLFLFIFLLNNSNAEIVKIFEFTDLEISNLEVRKVRGADNKTDYSIGSNDNGNYLKAIANNAASGLGKLFQRGDIQKNYLSLLAGSLKADKLAIDQSLQRNRDNYKNSVSVSKYGKEALSYISLISQFKDCCLVDIKIETGRMHQIRVHASSINQPVCGDTKYGDMDINKRMRYLGLKRMFLNSKKLSFFYKGQHDIEASTPADLALVIDNLKNEL